MNARLFVGIAAVSTLLAACSGTLKYQPQTSARAPEADANVTADVNEQIHQTRLSVVLVHLAPPARIQKGAEAYVAWQRKNKDAVWTRVGALSYDADDRKGALTEATVPETAFELLVTAEEAADVASPSPNVVVSQSVSK